MLAELRIATCPFCHEPVRRDRHEVEVHCALCGAHGMVFEGAATAVREHARGAAA